MMLLPNTLYCLNRRKALRVAYFGGSITENGGETGGWRGKTTAFLRERFPQAEITEINAAIGGTGSALGVYRCDTDVISRAPDLVFLEFAVNDGGCDRDTVGRNMEAILRKLYAANPFCEIVMVFTITKAILDNYAKGIPFRSRDTHTELAMHYQLPFIDIGTAMYIALERAGGDWLRYTNDNVHPNDAGYEFCAQEAYHRLSQLLAFDTPDAPIEQPLPEPLFDRLPVDAHLYDLSPLCPAASQPDTRPETEWKRLYLHLCGRWPRTIGANKPGSELVIPFRGPSFGLYYMIASDSGMLEYRLDDGEWQMLNTFDHYALSFARAAFKLLFDGLRDGEHTLTLRVSADKDPQSAGHWIRLSAMGACRPASF